MRSALSPRQSELSARRWATEMEPPVEDIIRPEHADDPMPDRPALGRRLFRGLTRFVITFGIGVAATLAWQSYGDTARDVIANASPQLAWLATPSAPDSAAPEARASAPDVEQLRVTADLAQLKAGLAVVRQSVDQLVAGQERMTRDITRMQAAEQDILQKVVVTPQPAAAPAPVRKPVLPPPPTLAAPVR